MYLNTLLIYYAGVVKYMNFFLENRLHSPIERALASFRTIIDAPCNLDALVV